MTIFSQNLALEKNPYVFPPFRLIFSVLKVCADSGVSRCTFVVPEFSPKPVWWPFIWQHVVEWYVLVVKGEKNVILYPSVKGFSYDEKGLLWPLIVAKLKF